MLSVIQKGKKYRFILIPFRLICLFESKKFDFSSNWDCSPRAIIVINLTKQNESNLRAEIPLFTLPGTNYHFTYRLIESSFDPKSAPNSNRNRLPRNWPSSPIRATCWSCSNLFTIKFQLNTSEEIRIIRGNSIVAQEGKIYLEILQTSIRNEILHFFHSLSLFSRARDHRGSRVVTRNENEVGFETAYYDREELLAIHHRARYFHSRRKDTEKGNDLSSYQLVTSTSSSEKTSERENEKGEKMEHGLLFRKKLWIERERERERTILEENYYKWLYDSRVCYDNDTYFYTHFFDIYIFIKNSPSFGKPA